MMVPVLLLLEESRATVPAPSSKVQCAIGPFPACACAMSSDSTRQTATNKTMSRLDERPVNTPEARFNSPAGPKLKGLGDLRSTHWVLINRLSSVNYDKGPIRLHECSGQAPGWKT